MPIYEYRCADCGFQEEHLQKVSDPPLAVCPKCGKASFRKMLSAAGFQLKGSGWYATDFRNTGAKTDKKTEAKPEAKADAKTEPAKEAKTPAKSDPPAGGGTASS